MGTRAQRDLHRIAVAREAVGSGVALMVDANRGYQAKQALRIADAATELGVTWFEEPVSSDDLAGLALLRSATRGEVAAGEYGTDPGYFQRMCATGAVDCLQVDATRAGGYTGFLAGAAIADAHGLQVSAHCAPTPHARSARRYPTCAIWSTSPTTYARIGCSSRAGFTPPGRVGRGLPATAAWPWPAPWAVAGNPEPRR